MNVEWERGAIMTLEEIKECGVQGKSTGEKYKIYEIRSCFCKWNRGQNYFWDS